MEQQVKTQVRFDIHKTLRVIESIKAIDEIFRDGNKELSYSLLHVMAKNDTLSQDTLLRIQQIFESIILKNKEPLDAYLKIADITPTKKKLPKHYGKKRILADAKDGLTELDRAMLALNTMRNIYSKLKHRGIKDKLTDKKKLTTEDCRDIIAVVRILENRTKNILNKK
jgi:hypothetical protein